MPIDNIRLDEYTVAIHDGRLHVLHGNELIAADTFPGDKALLAAAHEISELRTQRTPYRGGTLTGATALLDERIEDGKYTLLSTIWGVSLLRHGELWLDEDHMFLPELWHAVGVELRELRACAALV